MKLVNYVKASYDELVHKVSWTPMKELQSLAVTVMVASVVIALAVLVMDLAFENVMKAIYSVLAH
ncbi:MAG: preprotein translocase subunit SecE [Tidjanibacter sp.]|nr:preprotein translocase subunit SecE [Tidjanibacter sp.]